MIVAFLLNGGQISANKLVTIAVNVNVFLFDLSLQILL